MHITLYKAGHIPIPPPGYGGTERVIFWLGKGLVELGHKVTLIANQDSHVPGVEVRPLPANKSNPPAWSKLIPNSTDIVHTFDGFQESIPKPFVLTVGGNGGPGERFPANTVFVSRKHAANHGSRHFVYNGIDLSEYDLAPQREDYAVFLAKARWPVKNFAGAANLARRAGLELRVMGSRNWPLNLHRLLPAIRGVRYYGMLGGQAKRDLLSRARCLIFPVRWEEPFGLALTEALASGAYVLATPYGSIPEIITPPVGRLSQRAADLIEAAKNPQLFDPQTCRQHVQTGGFTHLDMAKKYLLYYQQILERGSLLEAGESAPATKPGFIAKQLLPWED